MNKKPNEINNSNKDRQKPSYQSYNNLNFKRNASNDSTVRHDYNPSQDINYQNNIPFNYPYPSMMNHYIHPQQDMNSYLQYYHSLISQGGNSFIFPQINPTYNTYPQPPVQMVNYTPQNMIPSNSIYMNDPSIYNQDISQHIKNLQNTSKLNPHFIKKRNDSNIDELLKLYHDNKDSISGVINPKKQKQEETNDDKDIDVTIDSNQKENNVNSEINSVKTGESSLKEETKKNDVNTLSNIDNKSEPVTNDSSTHIDLNSSKIKETNSQQNKISETDNERKLDTSTSNTRSIKTDITHIPIDHELSEQIKEHFSKGSDFNLADLCFSKQQKEEEKEKPEKKVYIIANNNF